MTLLDSKFANFVIGYGTAVVAPAILAACVQKGWLYHLFAG